MTEKRRPSHLLADFKRASAREGGVAITLVALRGAAALGFDLDDIKATIAGMETRHFVKSMTSYADHTAWQDVYHVPTTAGVAYVKFTKDTVAEFRLLSFKEKD